jgi:hypothetical protein
MSELSRRLFLKGSTAVETQAPADVGEAQAAVDEGEASVTMSEPLVAHVRDLASGEIGLFSGTREVTVLDPRLAAALVKALR